MKTLIAILAIVIVGCTQKLEVPIELRYENKKVVGYLFTFHNTGDKGIAIRATFKNQRKQVTFDWAIDPNRTKLVTALEWIGAKGDQVTVEADGFTGRSWTVE